MSCEEQIDKILGTIRDSEIIGEEFIVIGLQCVGIGEIPVVDD